MQCSSCMPSWCIFDCGHCVLDTRRAEVMIFLLGTLALSSIKITLILSGSLTQQTVKMKLRTLSNRHFCTLLNDLTLFWIWRDVFASFWKTISLGAIRPSTPESEIYSSSAVRRAPKETKQDPRLKCKSSQLCQYHKARSSRHERE